MTKPKAGGVASGAGKVLGGPIDFDRLAAAIATAGDRWVKLDHAWRVLCATKDIVKAQLMLQIRTRQGGAQKHLEAAVLVSPAWHEFVLAEVSARTAANAAQVNLKLAQTNYDGARSANAARNAELKHLGG
jgi:hypothetical protein